MIKSLKTLSLSLALVLACSSSAFAASNPASGLVVSPAIEQINLAKGQSSAVFNASVTNSFNRSVVVQVVTSDFTALNDTGSVSFLTKTGASKSTHGLASYLTPSETQVALAANQTQQLSVKIDNVSKLAAGGHYGALIFKVLPSGSSVSGNTFSSNEEVSLLVFLTTATGGTHSVNLDEPSISSVVTNLPKKLNLVFTNNGNTQISPHGLVTITDSKGTAIGNGQINAISGLVLPGTSRLYGVSLNYSRNSNLSGKYTVNISYQATSSSVTHVYSKKIILINGSLLIVLGVIVLAILIILIRVTGRKPAKPEPEA